MQAIKIFSEQDQHKRSGIKKRHKCIMLYCFRQKLIQR